MKTRSAKFPYYVGIDTKGKMSNKEKTKQEQQVPMSQSNTSEKVCNWGLVRTNLFAYHAHTYTVSDNLKKKSIYEQDIKSRVK